MEDCAVDAPKAAALNERVDESTLAVDCSPCPTNSGSDEKHERDSSMVALGYEVD